MNRSAREHLAKAKDFLAKGEGFYHKAAKEIVAAQEADPTLSNAEIGKAFGKGKDWVGQLVRWHTSDDVRSAPFGERSQVRMPQAARMLREAPMEQVEQIIAKLPPARRQAIAAAAEPTAYREARRDYNEEEARLTPAQRAGREAAAGEATRPIREAAAGFTALGIVGHLEQATEELRELVGDDSVTARLLRQIEKAHQEWCTELEVARGMAGLEAR